jgi:hypothetical protein
MNGDRGEGVPVTPAESDQAPTPGGGGGQVEDDRAAALAAYLEVNRGRYTDGALRRAASSGGYTDAEIDAAIAAAVTSQDVGSRRRTKMLVAIPVAILYVVGVYLAVSFFGSRAQYDLTLPAFVVAGIAGLVGWALLRKRRPSLSLGLGLGVILAIVLPVVLFLVLLGMCIVSGGTPILTGG